MYRITNIIRSHVKHRWHEESTQCTKKRVTCPRLRNAVGDTGRPQTADHEKPRSCSKQPVSHRKVLGKLRRVPPLKEVSSKHKMGGTMDRAIWSPPIFWQCIGYWLTGVSRETRSHRRILPRGCAVSVIVLVVSRVEGNVVSRYSNESDRMTEGRPRQYNASVLVAVLLSEIHKVSAQYGMQSGKCLLANCTSGLAPKATIFSLPIYLPTYLSTFLPTYLPTYLPTWPQYLVAVVYVILLFRIVPLKKHSQGCSFHRCGGGDDRQKLSFVIGLWIA